MVLITVMASVGIICIYVVCLQSVYLLYLLYICLSLFAVLGTRVIKGVASLAPQPVNNAKHLHLASDR